jgi:hypothetical protein
VWLAGVSTRWFPQDFRWGLRLWWAIGFLDFCSCVPLGGQNRAFDVWRSRFPLGVVSETLPAPLGHEGATFHAANLSVAIGVFFFGGHAWIIPARGWGRGGHGGSYFSLI